VVNVYDQKIPNSSRRPAEEINWSRLLRGRCIIEGDMNAHSRMWNVRVGRTTGNTRFWEGIVEDFECRIWNTEEEGYNAANHSIINLTLSIGDVELNWFITGDEHHTGSDHAVIGWEILGLGSVATVETVTGWDVSGWNTVGVYDKKREGKEDKGPGGSKGNLGDEGRTTAGGTQQQSSGRSGGGTYQDSNGGNTEHTFEKEEGVC